MSGTSAQQWSSLGWSERSAHRPRLWGRPNVIAAAKRGADALGIELDPSLVIKARRAAKQAQVETKARFHEGDLFAQDLSAATVVTLYLFPMQTWRFVPSFSGS